MIESFRIVLKVETSSHSICKNVESKEIEGMHEVVAYSPTVLWAPFEWTFVWFGNRQRQDGFFKVTFTCAPHKHIHAHTHTCGFTKGCSKFFLPALSLDSWILSLDATHIPTLWILPNCSLDVKNKIVFVFPNTNTEVFHEVLCLCLTHQCWLVVEVPGMFILKLKSWIHNCHPGVYSLGIPVWMGVLGMGMLLDIFQRFLKARW